MPDGNVKWKRNAAFFIAGQFISMFGSMLVSYAITWHITLREQSGGLIALFTVATMLPMVFISPVAGVWADRYNRKYLINISDAAIALVTLSVAILYSSGMQSVWFLLAAAMARSVGQGIQQPAVSALIPQIVPEEHLTRFNGIQSAAQSLTMFAAPMAAGALLTFLPIGNIFFIDVATAVIGIAAVFFFVKVPHAVKQAEHGAGAKAYFHEMMEGLRFIGGQAWLKTLIIATALFMVMASPSAMMTPLQVTRTFGGEVWRLTAIEIAFSVGMMIGGIVIAAWGGFKNKAHSMLLAWMLYGVSTLLFGVIPNFWVYLGVMVFCGCIMPLYNTPSMTLLQMKIPPQFMGRVFSVMSMISGLAFPLGMTLFGPLGDIVRIELLLIVTGVLLLTGGLFLLKRRELFEAGKPSVSP
ncbi:MAG: MFS transporter [Clostridiales bacterium]|jgi:DHA3 family macrolide efflux protein-like MFS transporter|nr:MFS transporter [Clostridiales bacterium]